MAKILAQLLILLIPLYFATDKRFSKSTHKLAWAIFALLLVSALINLLHGLVLFEPSTTPETTQTF
jgi:hypothetical protein